jgi:hypothetical protein
MKVRSEDLAKVRFPEGRHGYDADKVDAVLSEILETLRDYEAADEALHRTFVEAQRIKDEIIAEAGVEASAMRAEGDKAKAAAQIEAEKVIQAAKDDAARQRDITEDNVAKAKAEIDRRLAEADGQAAEKITAAERDASAVRSEAAKDAEKVRVDAAAEASSRVAEARKESTDMLTAAKAEHAILSKKVPQLRTAVSDIRGHLVALAKSAQTELDVVDGMIDLAAEEAIPVTSQDPEAKSQEPATVRPEPAPLQAETKPEPLQAEPKPEPAKAEAAPEPAKAEAAPEPAKAEAAPEPVAKEATQVAASPFEKTETAAAEAPAVGSAMAGHAPDDEPLFDSSSLKSLAGDLGDAVPDEEAKETFYGSGLRRRLTEKSKKGR